MSLSWCSESFPGRAPSPRAARRGCSRPTTGRRGAVAAVLHEQLGRAVPPRHDVLGEQAGAPLARLARGVLGLLQHVAREAEVGERELAVAVEEEVGRLHVAVDDAGVVEVRERAEDLEEHVLHVGVRERLRRVDDAVEVGVVQPRHQVHVAPAVGREGGRRHHVDQVEHVGVAQRPQQPDLAEEALRVGAVGEGVHHLLHRRGRAAGGGVVGLTGLAVAASFAAAAVPAAPAEAPAVGHRACSGSACPRRRRRGRTRPCRRPT